MKAEFAQLPIFHFSPIAAKRGITDPPALDLLATAARVVALEQSRLIERSIELPFKETARATGPFRCSGRDLVSDRPTGTQTHQLAAKRGVTASHPLDLAVTGCRVLALEQDGLIERSIRSVQTETARETGPFRFLGRTRGCRDFSADCENVR